MLKAILAPPPLSWTLSIVLSVLTAPAFGEEVAPRNSAAITSAQIAPKQSSPPGPAAKRIYVDPQSGRLLSSPPAGVAVLALSAKEQQMVSRSHVGLYE